MGSLYEKRAAELVKIHLVDLLRTRVNDPRVQMVTITDVEVNTDATQAKVYFSVLGDREERDAALAGLQSAAGFMRRELGPRIRLRNTPELLFYWDASFERGERIAGLLDQLKDDFTDEPGTE
ncbi:MAG: 30S ribosome-binding factor RbfA [Anaerolineae bacterium]|nr:30S ribosome-binding factor RbfA [Anaerolineae bacterium]